MKKTLSLIGICILALGGCARLEDGSASSREAMSEYDIDEDSYNDELTTDSGIETETQEVTTEVVSIIEETIGEQRDTDLIVYRPVEPEPEHRVDIDKLSKEEMLELESAIKYIGIEITRYMFNGYCDSSVVKDFVDNYMTDNVDLEGQSSPVGVLLSELKFKNGETSVTVNNTRYIIKRCNVGYGVSEIIENCNSDNLRVWGVMPCNEYCVIEYGAKEKSINIKCYLDDKGAIIKLLPFTDKDERQIKELLEERLGEQTTEIISSEE